MIFEVLSQKTLGGKINSNYKRPIMDAIHILKSMLKSTRNATASILQQTDINGMRYMSIHYI